MERGDFYSTVDLGCAGRYAVPRGVRHRERADLMFGMSELAVILLVVVVVLGIRKLPELTRSAGRAARIFKSESRALKDQGATDDAAGPGRVVRGTVVDGEAPRPRH